MSERSQPRRSIELDHQQSVALDFGNVAVMLKVECNVTFLRRFPLRGLLVRRYNSPLCNRLGWDRSYQGLGHGKAILAATSIQASIAKLRSVGSASSMVHVWRPGSSKIMFGADTGLLLSIIKFDEFHFHLHQLFEAGSYSYLSPRL